MNAFFEDEPMNQHEQTSPFFTNDFTTQYELAEREGNRRFGSQCKHEHVRNGKCIECLRKVVTQSEAIS